MKKHQKNSPDYFDDYSTMEPEEESIPMEDTYSRPSKAWWESRDNVSDEVLAEEYDPNDPDVDFSDLGIDLNDPMFDPNEEYVPVANDVRLPEGELTYEGELPSEAGELPYEAGYVYEGNAIPYEGEYAPEGNEGFYGEQYVPEGQEQYDPYSQEFGEGEYYPDNSEGIAYAENGELPCEEAGQAEDIPPMPYTPRPITPESIPVRNWNPDEEYADDDVPTVPRKAGKPFKKKLIRYLIILAAVFVGLLALLWVLLDRYQNKQDTIAEAEALAQQKAEEEAAHALAVKRAPQLAFSAWYDAMTSDDWVELWYKDQPEGIDGKDRVRQYMEELFSDPTVSACKGLDSTEDAPVFVIKSSEQELVRATMSGTDVNWSVANAKLMLKGDKSASIRVAVGTKVLCNGKELTDEYAGEAESTFSYEPLKEFLVNPTSWVTYEVKGMLLDPELTFEAPEGCNITETADGDCFLCLDDTLDEAKGYQKKATDFVKAYLFYYLSGLNGTYGNLYTALAYVEPGSQAYTDLQDTYNGVIWNSAHTEIDTTDITTSGVVIWADNCYSVDVTYHATGNVQGQVDEYDATMRVYFTDSGEGFALTHFETL